MAAGEGVEVVLRGIACAEPGRVAEKKTWSHMAIDALGFTPGRAFGAQTYLLSVLSALSRLRGRRAITVFCTKDAEQALGAIAPGIVFHAVQTPRTLPGRVIFAQRVGWGLIESCGADVAFFPFNHSWPSPVPCVLMVHDLVGRFYRRRFPLSLTGRMLAHDFMVGRSIRRASAVVCPSRAIAIEIIARYGIDESTVAVAHEAPGLAIVSERQEGFAIPRWCYRFVAVGSHLPHKDLATAVQALAAVRAQSTEIFEQAGLILTGSGGREVQRLAARLGVSERVYVTGHLRDEQLWWLYSQATALVMSSLYEGFGLPILEAQHAGLPVIVSDIPVAREISGDHAWFFPPGNHRALAQQMINVIGHAEHRRLLVDEARRRAAGFRWEAHVRVVMESCDRAVAVTTSRNVRSEETRSAT